MQEQSSLGNRKVHDQISYNMTQIGRVTSTANYDTVGRIEVAFLDYSKPAPVWVVGSLDKKPVEGDLVLVGFIQGRADAPYLAGFVRNDHYTANYIKVEKDRVVIQIATNAADIAAHMVDDQLKPTRSIVEITSSGVLINGAYAARVGDTVSVSVPTHGTCTGTITSGATK